MTKKKFEQYKFDDAPEDTSLADNPVVPRDAATMILVRKDGPEPRILMGRRTSGHDFMPDKYVFPGGRLDKADFEVTALDKLNTNCRKSLLVNSDTPPEALALAAIRETFEETGLIIGRRPTDDNIALEAEDASWNAFLSHAFMPSLTNIEFIGRAVTPPYQPKRFDARFFLAESNQVLAQLTKPIDTFELEGLKWFTFDEIESLDLPRVTRFTIQEVQERVENPSRKILPFFFSFDGVKASCERIPPN